MPSYSFKLILKEKLGIFGKYNFVSTMKESCVRYNQFVFGKNIKSVKNVKIDGVNVSVSLHLFHTITDKEFEDAVTNVIKLMKKHGYSLQKENHKKRRSNKRKTRKIKK